MNIDFCFFRTSYGRPNFGAAWLIASAIRSDRAVFVHSAIACSTISENENVIVSLATPFNYVEINQQM